MISNCSFKKVLGKKKCCDIAILGYFAPVLFYKKKKIQVNSETNVMFWF